MEPPQETLKRRKFQLHLSTCLVLVVVAGLLIWKNVETKRGYDVWRRGSSTKLVVGYWWGWPWIMNEVERSAFITRADASRIEGDENAFWQRRLEWLSYGSDRGELDRMMENVSAFSGTWDIPTALLNGASCLTILMLVGVILEWVIQARRLNSSGEANVIDT